MNTTTEQFVQDYTLVVDNDQDAYNEACFITRYSENLATASDRFREEFENYISEVADREEEAGREVGALLIRQMLIGQGSSAFDAIARHYMEKDKN